MPVLEILSLHLFDETVVVDTRETAAGRLWQATLDYIDKVATRTRNPPTDFPSWYWGFDQHDPTHILILIMWPDFKDFIYFHRQSLAETIMNGYLRKSATVRFVSDFGGLDALDNVKEVVMALNKIQGKSNLSSVKRIINNNSPIPGLRVIPEQMRQCVRRDPPDSFAIDCLFLTVEHRTKFDVSKHLPVCSEHVRLKRHERSPKTDMKMPRLDRVSDLFYLDPGIFASEHLEPEVPGSRGPGLRCWRPPNQRCPPPMKRPKGVDPSKNLDLVAIYVETVNIFFRSDAMASNGMNLLSSVEEAWMNYRKTVCRHTSKYCALQSSASMFFANQPRRAVLCMEWDQRLKKKAPADRFSAIQQAFQALEGYLESSRVDFDVHYYSLPTQCQPKRKVEIITFDFLHPLSEADDRAWRHAVAKFAEARGAGGVSTSLGFYDASSSESSEESSDGKDAHKGPAVSIFSARWLQAPTPGVAASYQQMYLYESENMRRQWVLAFAHHTYDYLGFRVHGLGLISDRITSQDVVMAWEDFGQCTKRSTASEEQNDYGLLDGLESD